MPEREKQPLESVEKKIFTPEELPEEMQKAPKVLIDGWSASVDWAEEPDMSNPKHQNAVKELPPETLKKVQEFCGNIVGSFSKDQAGGKELPYFIAAGNTAGVQRRIAGAAETKGLKVMYGLPQGAEQYAETTKAPVISYPARKGVEGIDWGAELRGKKGIASVDFNVNRVLLVGGGEFVLQQIPLYLENVIRAYRDGKLYKIVAIEGVGGVSNRQRLHPEVDKLKGLDEDSFKKTFSSDIAGNYDVYKSIWAKENEWLKFISHDKIDQVKGELI